MSTTDRAAADGAAGGGAARERLRVAQAELARALLAGGAAPAGFDERRVRVEARALLNKRRRITELLRPDLVEALGDRYRAVYDGWAVTHPRPVGLGFRGDADRFGEWLVAEGLMPRPRRRRWPWGRRR
ncbi:MAG TPA: hypothetical protein VGD67_07825 [Pseudonocardiaceae bacterium]